jgi:hypothetical protein
LSLLGFAGAVPGPEQSDVAAIDVVATVGVVVEDVPDLLGEFVAVVLVEAKSEADDVSETGVLPRRWAS